MNICAYHTVVQGIAPKNEQQKKLSDFLMNVFKNWRKSYQKYLKIN
jgi:hypothetical protein